LFTPQKEGRPARVLLVEDNQDDIDLTLAALEQSKLRVEIDVAQDGEKALAFLRQEEAFADKARPDLILLDLNLPRKDGREVLRELKADGRLSDIPVVVLTTSESDEDVLKAYQLHANCYLVKPVDFEQFLKIVRAIEAFWLELVILPQRV